MERFYSESLKAALKTMYGNTKFFTVLGLWKEWSGIDVDINSECRNTKNFLSSIAEGNEGFEDFIRSLNPSFEEIEEFEECSLDDGELIY